MESTCQPSARKPRSRICSRCGNAIVVYVDAKDARRTASRLFVYSLPANHGTRGGPLGANIVGSSKRSGVVDDRTAAKAFARQQTDTVIDRGRRAAFGVQPLVTSKFGAVKIGIIVVAAGLDARSHLFRRAARTAAAVPPPAPEPITQTSQESYMSCRGMMTVNVRRRTYFFEVAAAPDNRSCSKPEFARRSSAAASRTGKKPLCAKLEKRRAAGQGCSRPRKATRELELLQGALRSAKFSQSKVKCATANPKNRGAAEIVCGRQARIKVHGLGDGFGNAELGSGGPSVRGGRKSVTNGLQRATAGEQSISSAGDRVAKAGQRRKHGQIRQGKESRLRDAQRA